MICKEEKIKILTTHPGILEIEDIVLQVGTFEKVLDDGPSNPKNTNSRGFGLFLIEF